MSATQVTLRPLDFCDHLWLAEWSRDPEVSAHFADHFVALAHRETVDRERRLGHRLSMVIHLGLSGPPVGLVELVDINPGTRTGELRVLIGEERYRGRGHGTDAIQQFLALVTCRLRLNLVYLRVATSNLRARRCYEKCGFRTRARLGVSRRQPARRDELLLMELAAPPRARGARCGRAARAG